MTEKRFNSYCDNENIRIRIDDDIKNKEVFHIYFAELDDALYCKSKLNPILDLLNQLNDENEQLRKQNQELIQGMQETARLSAKAITKPMVEERWGKGVDYD